MQTTQQMIDDAIRREGWMRYTNRKADDGGPTKGGITLPSLRLYRRRHGGKWRGLTWRDIKALQYPEIFDIYLQDFVKWPRFHMLMSEPIKILMFDTGINWHPRTATKWLQRLVGAKPDGIIGPKTLGKFNRAIKGDGAWRSIYIELCIIRIKYRGQRVKRRPDQLANINGWLNRDTNFLRKLS